MIQGYRAIREAAGHAADAAERVTEAIRDGRLEQEPAITDRMLGAVEEAMRGFTAKGITWTAKTLTDRGRGSQESRFGADFAGVLSIDLPGYCVSKGFLAQAKLIEPDESVPTAEFDHMQNQCDRMLSLTPDSFVFLYTMTEIRIVPALSVLSSRRRNPHDFYSRSIARFYEEHFECFIGDRKLSAATPDGLEALAGDYGTRRILFLGARAG